MDKVKAVTLVLDYSIYPRHEISDDHVRRLQDAVNSGHKLPPIVADRKSKRVIDGFNRLTRALRYDGEGAEIEVCWKNYATEEEMVLDAVALNSEHGLKFTTYDIARCITVAEELHIEVAKLAVALHVTVARLEDIRLRKTAIGPGSHLVPIKRTLGHLAGGRITKGQIEAQKHAVGHQQRFLVNQVINLIEGRILDSENAALMDRLAYLSKLLEPYRRAARKSA